MGSQSSATQGKMIASTFCLKNIQIWSSHYTKLKQLLEKKYLS